MVRRIKKQYKRHKRRQRSFLNRYDFAYAGRDTVNQTMKGLDTLASKVIKQTMGLINQIAQRRIINQNYKSERQQVEKNYTKK